VSHRATPSGCWRRPGPSSPAPRARSSRAAPLPAPCDRPAANPHGVTVYQSLRYAPTASEFGWIGVRT
jgi:hypothetical protein